MLTEMYVNQLANLEDIEQDIVEVTDEFESPEIIEVCIKEVKAIEPLVE